MVARSCRAGCRPQTCVRWPCRSATVVVGSLQPCPGLGHIGRIPLPDRAKCLRPPTRARRAPPTDPPFSLRSSALRLRAGPSTYRVLGRTAYVTTSRRSGSLASSTIRRPSPRRLCRRVTKAVHLRPKRVAALRTAFPRASSQAEVVGVVLGAAACLVRALVVMCLLRLGPQRREPHALTPHAVGMSGARNDSSASLLWSARGSSWRVCRN